MGLSKMTAKLCVASLVKVFLLIMGDSGTGKTRLGAIFSRMPLIALWERQGEPTILKNNENATVWKMYEDDDLGSYTGVAGGTITDPAMRVVKFSHIREALWMAEAQGDGTFLVPTPKVARTGDGKVDIAGWDWDDSALVDGFVVDTLTEYQSANFNCLLGRKAYDDTLVDFKDPRLGPIYQNLNRRTTSLCEELRDLPMHCLALGHVGDREVRGGLKAMLALSGDKVAPDLPRMATACGWLLAREIDQKVLRCCVFQGGSETAIMKWVDGLEAVEPLPEDPEENGPQDWIRRIVEAGTKRGGLPEARLEEDTLRKAAMGQVEKFAADGKALAKARADREAKRKAKRGEHVPLEPTGDGAEGGEQGAVPRLRRGDLK